MSAPLSQRGTPSSGDDVLPLTSTYLVAAAIAQLLPGGFHVPPREGVEVRGPVEHEGTAYLQVTFDDEQFDVIVRSANAGTD